MPSKRLSVGGAGAYGREDLTAQVERLEAELQQAQAALRSYEHLISQVYRHAKVHCWTWDAASGRVSHTTPTEGAVGSELRPVPLVDDYLDQIHPDDRARVGAAYERADGEGAEIDVEYRLRAADGSWRHLHEKGASLRDAEGHIVSQEGIVQDVTDLKQADARLRDSQRIMRAVIDSVPAAINIKERSGRVILVNKALANAYHLTPAEALEQWTSWEATRGDTLYNALSLRAADEQVFATGKAIPLGEYLYDVGDRQEVWLSSKLPIFGEAGDVKYVLTVSFDITERKATELQLRQAQKMEAIGQLTGGVAHDFNNLLAVILGNLELAGERAQRDPALQVHIEKALAACEPGARLVQQLLAFSRRQTLRPEAVDARELIVGVVELLRRTLDESIEIEMRHAAELWTCEVDRAQMESTILNLALNARDAMPDGGRLTIETANQWLEANQRLEEGPTASELDARPGGYVMVAVRDTGAGMTAEIKERIFEPFFTTKKVGRGSGLGLSMVYGFVKQSGGHILVESEAGSGTSFRIYLPRGDRDLAESVGGGT